MAWAGGFSGLGYTREEFRKYLTSVPVPAWLQFFVSHNTAAPYIKPPVPPRTRIRNLANYYQNEKKWPSGPNLFVIYDKVYVGTPLSTPGTNSPGFNGKSIGVETEGDYRPGKHDPFTGDGAVAWATTSWVFAELMAWAKKNPKDHLKLHRDDPRTTHKCPGAHIQKDWLVEKVSAQMGVSPPAEKPKPAETVRSTIKKGSTGGDVPVAQMRLRERGYYTGLVDGDFGPLTDEATRKFQGDHGLVVDGIIGPITWARLDKPAVNPVEPPTAPEAPPAVLQPEAPKPAPEAPPQPTEQNVNDLHISTSGRRVIEHFEGLRLTPYDDVGSLAIGYGHSNRSKKPPIVTPDLRITEKEADEILARDLIEYENSVKQIVKVPLAQHQFDALVSLAYNWGPGNLKRSELAKIVNSGNHKAAEAEIRRLLPDPSKKQYKGILRRRNREADLYAGK